VENRDAVARPKPVKRIIATENAPKAIGPYSQAVETDGWLFCSGQIPLAPKTGETVSTDSAKQAEQVLTNLKSVIEAAGGTMDDVVKVTVYLTDMGDFPAVNKVYEGFFAANPPARATVQVSALPKGVAVEMDAVARIGSKA
jgi:2-iminobutanoate/2-iminopropanoate deaminase